MLYVQVEGYEECNVKILNTEQYLAAQSYTKAGMEEVSRLQKEVEYYKEQMVALQNQIADVMLRIQEYEDYYQINKFR